MGQSLPAALVVGGICGIVSLIATQLSLPATAMVVVAGGGLAFLAVIGEIRRPLLALLAFIVPFHVSRTLMWRPAHIGGVSGFVIDSTDVVLLILVCLWIGEMTIGHRPIRFFPSISVPALLFIALGLASALIAIEPAFTAFQLVQWVKGFVLYLYLANHVTDEHDARWILVGLMAAVAFQSGLGLYEVIAQRPLGLGSLGEAATQAELILDWQGVRPRGTLVHANSLAAFLGMTLPLIATVFFTPAGRTLKILAGGVVFVGLMADVYTLSRGGWVGIIVSILILLALYPRGAHRRPFIRLLAGVPLLLILVVALNLLTGGQIVDRLTESDRGAAGARVPLMRGAWAVISDHPVIGTGMNNYLLAVEQYDPTHGLAQYDARGVVHNSFLLIAADTGLLGLAAFVWLLAAVGWRVLKFLFNHKVGWAAGLLIGLAAGGSHLIVHSMVDFVLLADNQLFVLFWILVGLMVGLTAQNNDLAQQRLDPEGEWASRSQP